MIVLFVHQTSGLIGKWVDVSVDDIESQQIPSGHVAVVSDRQPNYTGEAYVTDITRAAELDIPYIAIEFYTATIDGRRPPILPITLFSATCSFQAIGNATFIRTTTFLGIGEFGTAGIITGGSP